MKRFLLMMFVVGLSGCAALHSVSLTQIPSDRGQVVTASRSRMIFMAFNFDNDFVDELTTDLKSQCEGGVVSGILTKDESIYYIPGFLTKRAVYATGFCNKRG